MLNFPSNASSSDELRRARTTESANMMTQRQLQFGVRPRSSTSRDEETPSANSSRRMPDLQPRTASSSTTTRARGMSGGCVDALRRAIAFEHERAEAVVASKANKQQQRPRANTTMTWTTTRSSFQQKLRIDQIEMMKTKRMMGRSSSVSVKSKDRDLLMRSSSSSSARRSGRIRMDGRDPSEPSSEDDEDDEVMQELQMWPQADSLGFIPVDDHHALAASAALYEHEYDPEFDLNDGDDDDDEENDPGCYLVDTPELAAFLGLTIPHQQQQHQAYPPPMFPKAASFSGQHYSQYYQSQQSQPSQPQSLRGMVPCSPPVPIPPKQMLRRRNSVTGSLLTTNPSSTSSRKYHGGDVICDESNYSRTQCEARLWDEDWNFKLSLEARESFEASNNSKNNSSNNSRRAVWKPQSTSSMASTADTFRDEDEELIGSFGGMGVNGGENSNNNDSGDEDEDDADQVFDMDDL